MRKGRVFGRLILTTMRQPSGAKTLDGGTTTDAEGRHYGSLVVRMPGRQGALVIGWRDARTPNPQRWRRTRRVRPTGPLVSKTYDNERVEES
jgi:hypothetical protein